ncbi:MAG TPA: periplasmic nitrate reductase, NapE protein [Geminicoccaceae bacterium]
MDDARSTAAVGADEARGARRRELLVFLFLAVVLAPILAVMVVGGYGFLVWMSQMLLGPPTG